jgi:hypothetical protein
MPPEPDEREPHRRFSFRDETWGDEPQEVDASELVEELEATSPELIRRWQDHPTLVPFKIIGRFIRRSGKRIAVTIAGSLLVLAGLAGLILPIVPGWLLIIPGLALLATEYVWAQRLLKVAREKATQAKDLMLGKKKTEPEESPGS